MTRDEEPFLLLHVETTDIESLEADIRCVRGWAEKVGVPLTYNRLAYKGDEGGELERLASEFGKAGFKVDFDHEGGSIAIYTRPPPHSWSEKVRAIIQKADREDGVL